MGFVTVAVAAAALVLRSVRLAQAEADAQHRLEALTRESAESCRRLEEANAELRARNTQLLAVHISFADLLKLADERSGGHMRMLIESTGEELAEWLERQIEGHAKLDWPGDGAQRAVARK